MLFWPQWQKCLQVMYEMLIGSHIGSFAIDILYGPCQVSWAWKRFYNLGARSSCAWTEYYLGLCSAFIHSVVSIDSVCWQWRPWSDCMDAQADLGLNCSHMPEDTFSHGLAHIAPLLLWLDSEDRDQTAWTHKLICTFAVQICLKSPFCLRHLICKCILSK